MRGLDTLSPLPGVEGWGAPAALPGSVAALKSLRQSWLGVTGKEWFLRERVGKFDAETFRLFFRRRPLHLHKLTGDDTDLEDSRCSCVGLFACAYYGENLSTFRDQPSS